MTRMLLLIFHAGGARYGLETSGVVEVLPAATLRPVPGKARHTAGLLYYHGTVVPVIDLNAVLTGEPSRARLSSRIVVVNFRASDDANHLLGLLAECATETIHCRAADFQPAGVQAPDAPFSGDILVDAGGMLQKVEVGKLLPPELQHLLFTATAGANP